MERTHNHRETSRSLIIGQPSSNPSVATPPSYYRRIRRGVITYYQGIEGALPLIITYHVWSLDRPNYPFCLLFSIVHEAHDYIGTMSGLSQYSNSAWPVTCIGTMSGLSQYSNTAWPVTSPLRMCRPSAAWTHSSSTISSSVPWTASRLPRRSGYHPPLSLFVVWPHRHRCRLSSSVRHIDFVDLVDQVRCCPSILHFCW